MSKETGATNGSEIVPVAITVPASSKKQSSKSTTTKKSVKKTPAKARIASTAGSDDLLDNRELLSVLADVRNGNFNVRLPVYKTGIDGKICDTLNEIITLNEILVQELTEARKVIGKQGKLDHHIELPRSARGAWLEGANAINSLISFQVPPTS